MNDEGRHTVLPPEVAEHRGKSRGGRGVFVFVAEQNVACAVPPKHKLAGVRRLRLGVEADVSRS